jgi:hypothetical protein
MRIIYIYLRIPHARFSRLCDNLPIMTPSLKLESREASLCVWWEDRPVFTYAFTGSPKPHVSLLATPAGEVVTLDSPHDHVHHRGLMFACKVEGVNFWEETAVPGEDAPRGDIVHLRWDRRACDGRRVELVEALDWKRRADGEVLLNEERSLCVEVDAERGAVRCEWRTQLTNPSGHDIVLSGQTPYSPISYYGLGLRFARALDHSGTHLNAKGPCALPESNGARSAWHDYSGTLDSSHARVGVLIADAPTNPRHPTEWFLAAHPPAPFAYVTAAMLAREDYTLGASGVLELHYAVWAHADHWTSATCQHVVDTYFQPVSSL